MLQVGINENVHVKKVYADDNSLLNIEFSDTGDGAGSSNGQGAVNFISELSSTSESDMSFDVRYIVWPVKYGEYVKNMEDVLKEFKNIRQVLNHILLQYTTEDHIQWDPMKGIQIANPQDTAEIQRLLSNDAILLNMYNNYRDQFIMMMTQYALGAPVSGEPKKFRVKFTRQSVAKHYASLPKFPPFMEPMHIPEAQSKLKFTQYEIDKGLNSGTKVEETAKVADAPISAEEQEEIDSVFNR